MNIHTSAFNPRAFFAHSAAAKRCVIMRARAWRVAGLAAEGDGINP